MKAEIAAKQPKEVQLVAGNRYSWCTCGKSANQPFCDGAHTGTEFRPVLIKAETTESVYLCQCKQTTHPSGLCDGTHNSL